MGGILRRGLFAGAFTAPMHMTVDLNFHGEDPGMVWSAGGNCDVMRCTQFIGLGPFLQGALRVIAF